MDEPFSGIALLDKTEGETSFAALAGVKRVFNTRRVGHTGTLDPMATGLLVALVGPATRTARYFNGLDKEYVAEVTLGFETDTEDRTGTATRSAPVPAMEAVLEAAEGFIGRIAQVPPAYSAVHVDGERAYKLARSGEQVDLPERQVTIHQLRCEPLTGDTFRMTVRCSSGTYVRSLARDIARAAGGAAHLSELRRTRVGPFTVDEIPHDATNGAARAIGTLSVPDALLRLDGFSASDVGAQTAKLMWNGAKIAPGDELEMCDGNVLVLSDSRPVCIGTWQNARFRYDLVFPGPERST